MDPVRIGCVRFLNTSVLVEGLDQVAGLTLAPDAPARLIDQLLERRVDIALASVIDAARVPEPVVLLPVGMIGCEGPTLTVRIFSSCPLARIRTLHVDRESHTSVALARVLLERTLGVSPALVPFDALDVANWPESMLLIGDKVVASPPPPERYGHELDLGEAWHAWTGLPFVYAVWMCRAADADDPRVRTAAALLERQRLHNQTRLGWIARTRAPRHGWPPETALRYLTQLLRYDVGPRERDAVARFLEEAARLDPLPRPRPVWAEWASTAPAA